MIQFQQLRIAFSLVLSSLHLVFAVSESNFRVEFFVTDQRSHIVFTFLFTKIGYKDKKDLLANFLCSTKGNDYVDKKAKES